MAELECILADGYDREVFARIAVKSAAVEKAKARIERILPHGEMLLRDLFFALYKLNVVLRPIDETSGAVLVHRRLLQAVLESPGLGELRKRTELSEVECAAALPVLVDRIAAALAKEYRIGPRELAELAELADKEAELARLEAEREHLDELPEGALDAEDEEALEESLDGDIEALSKEIAEARRSQAKLASNLTTSIEDTVEQHVKNLPEEIDDTAEQLRALGLGQGSDGRVPADRRMELGEKLLRSKKLKLLARLVGAFRGVAFEARRKRIAKTPQTAHSVHYGAHLDRLLPSEHLGVPRRRRALHLDFLRRYVDGQLLEYELVGAADRGPMVIVVDGSASMSGSKELWAKAVALTLMEIARRERRACLALIFSAGDPLAEFELVGSKKKRGARARIADDEVLRFAEHFPRGGTEYEQPLRRALDAVTEGRYRRGDVVFITDGEASVSPELVEEVKEKRKKHRFAIRGILVDVAHHEGGVLEQFCDEVRRVSDLGADALGDLFAAV
ncbi:VWA domain-containing protein [Myxococcota bacterium]|nr:VWA domain-containing protein [Myxococcota bacterium]